MFPNPKFLSIDKVLNMENSTLCFRCNINKTTVYRLCEWGVGSISQFHVMTWVPSPRYPIMYVQILYWKIPPHPKSKRLLVWSIFTSGYTTCSFLCWQWFFWHVAHVLYSPPRTFYRSIGFSVFSRAVTTTSKLEPFVTSDRYPSSFSCPVS